MGVVALGLATYQVRMTDQVKMGDGLPSRWSNESNFAQATAIPLICQGILDRRKPSSGSKGRYGPGNIACQCPTQLNVFGRISKIIREPGWEGKAGSPPSPDTYPHPPFGTDGTHRAFGLLEPFSRSGLPSCYRDDCDGAVCCYSNPCHMHMVRWWLGRGGPELGGMNAGFIV